MGRNSAEPKELDMQSPELGAGSVLFKMPATANVAGAEWTKGREMEGEQALEK